mmetsp:Transcript_946/g.2223  ORF Transcript_946/g.2223 Transcript_946/m.2223 type:complete len:216 (+) Transcript_946:763-1410(+)
MSLATEIACSFFESSAPFWERAMTPTILSNSLRLEPTKRTASSTTGQPVLSHFLPHLICAQRSPALNAKEEYMQSRTNSMPSPLSSLLSRSEIRRFDIRRRPCTNAYTLSLDTGARKSWTQMSTIAVTFPLFRMSLRRPGSVLQIQRMPSKQCEMITTPCTDGLPISCAQVLIKAERTWREATPRTLSRAYLTKVSAASDFSELIEASSRCLTAL